MPDWRGVVEARLTKLSLPPARAAEIVDELSQHLQDRYDELRAGGATEAEAYRAAIADVGVGDRLAHGLARVERHAAPLPPPGTGGRTAMDAIWQDVRYPLRLWRRAPAFTAVVLATLALGIGANTAMFTVIDAVLLRRLPFPDPDRIIILNEATRSGDLMAVSWPNYRDWRAQNTDFEHLGLFRFLTVNLTGGDQPERLNGAVMTSEALAAMGLPPVAGRWFRDEEDRAGTVPVALISERLWRTRFGGDPGLVGRALTLNGVPHVIVGIMPPDMRFPSRLTDVWLCFGDIGGSLPQARGNPPTLTGVGRLKPGVPFERARGDMDTVARRLERQYPESNRDNTVAMIPYREQIVQNIRPIL